MSERIAIIGGGKIGEALLAGLIGAGTPTKDLVVAERVESRAAEIAEEAMRAYPELFAVEVTIHKPQAPIDLVFDDVAVVARRSRKSMH